MTNYDNVSTRALLVTLNISAWDARKFDKEVTEATTKAQNATAKAGRWNKDLLGGSVIRERVLQASRQARKAHNLHTLPWSDNGERLLPIANYQTYVDTMRGARSIFETAVDDLIANYDDITAQAKIELGDSWNAADYPTKQEVRQKFGWDISFDPIPAMGDVRVGLPAEDLASIEARIESRVVNATKAAMLDAWSRLREAVTRIAKAAEPDGVLRDNVIQHARDTADLLVRLNVANDADLDLMGRRVMKELGSLDVDSPRDDDTLRATAKTKADAILNSMAAFFPADVLSRTDAA